MALTTRLQFVNRRSDRNDIGFSFSDGIYAVLPVTQDLDLANVTSDRDIHNIDDLSNSIAVLIKKEYHSSDTEYDPTFLPLGPASVDGGYERIGLVAAQRLAIYFPYRLFVDQTGKVVKIYDYQPDNRPLWIEQTKMKTHVIELIVKRVTCHNVETQTAENQAVAETAMLLSYFRLGR
ncbi:hypothetical protein BCR34DRAFT_588357 [Clohesyomyces aquaticus]|uniref:Uncharacterized protein n=1 Tax=Clohesyomyces aquaticus TaxID=1231657 RepID=A0A1Y1ZLU8_9PLEO|nr:hypothetical protein BCR34DRAFT_588357 [Clohesyomyces aquaticus]